ncbi:MAG: hypothetical protein RLZ92_1672 [Pseudomonadota bacterium]|jgi:hypothetical protein
MKHKSLLAVVTLSMLLTGCSLFSNSDAEVTPKKVQPKKAAAKKAPPAPVAKKPAQPAPGTGTATYAIDDGKTGFKVESTMPAFQGESLMPQVQQSPIPQSQPVQPAPAVNPPLAEPTISAPVQPQVSAPAMTAPQPPVTVATVAPAMLSINVEDAAVPSGTSPAVVALINEAERNRGRGDLDGAVTIMERALRIDSRNPTLTYKLAQLRLKQSKPQLAEDLAGKAALLAGSDLDLKRKSWLLIAEARQNQQNFQGAKDAKAKAESFFGR